MNRLRSIEIRNFRGISSLELPLKGLTVLVGENGTGKSTIIQALELLSLAGRSPRFVRDLLSFHGRPLDLFRAGTSVMELSAVVEAQNSELSYSFSLHADPTKTWATVTSELLDVRERAVTSPQEEPLRVIERAPFSSAVFDIEHQELRTIEPASDQLLLSFFGSAAQPAIASVQQALQGIRVHVPFDTTPAWIAEEQKRQPGMRAPATFEPVTRLARLGTNLPNAFNTLKNRQPEAWRAVLEDVRSGLGADVEDVQVQAVGRGLTDLALKFRAVSAPVFSSGLSDGQLSFLAFVALRHLDDAAALIAFDEPETHLHPGLLARVVWLFEELAEKRPVILATHSDALLNMLSNPIEQVRVCRLDAERQVHLERLDPDRFERFRMEFGGLGDLRREGLLSSVVVSEASA